MRNLIASGIDVDNDTITIPNAEYADLIERLHRLETDAVLSDMCISELESAEESYR